MAALGEERTGARHPCTAGQESALRAITTTKRREECGMPATYDAVQESHPDPVMTEADVLGLYSVTRAAAAARWTTTIDPVGGEQTTGPDD